LCYFCAMPHKGRLGLWIGGAVLLATVSTSCCRQKGTVCLYDKPCGGKVGVSWTPEEEWGYAFTVQLRGSYAPNTKGIVVIDENGSDEFIVWGDGRVLAHRECEFRAPIKVKEIYTDSGAKWPDYVFEPSYKLRSLYDLEAFVRQNKHLPGLPSQKTVGQQGIPLVTTQKALVEKVEELTLYVIALQKQIDSLKALVQIQSAARPR